MTLLEESQNACYDTAARLWAEINDPATSPADRKQLRLEFIEVNHRLQISLGQQLKQETEQLKAKAVKFREARKELQEVLDTVKDIEKRIKAVTAFLAAVDSFLDTAKKFFIPA